MRGTAHGAAPSVSVIILTFNEEANIQAAIASVSGWAKEIFVVDSFSTDRTIDRVLELGDPSVGLVQNRFESYPQQWNWALRSLPLTGDWTLKLDADERVTPEFKKEAAELLSSLGMDVEGVIFRRRIQLTGDWIESGAVRKNYDLRMWRTGRASFENRPINEHALVTGKTVRMKSFVDHCDAKSITEWIDRQNRYTSLETLSRIRGDFSGAITPRLFGTAVERRYWLKRVYFRLPLRPFLFFLVRFIGQLGFLDGRAGFRHAVLESFFLYIQDLKELEYRRRGLLPVVRWPERGICDPRVAASPLQKLVDSNSQKPPLL